MSAWTAVSDRDYLESVGSGDASERPKAAKELRDERFRAIADAVQEAVESGDEDYTIDRAVAYGRETASAARRESELCYRSLEN